jgi:hypothetical protein
MDVPRACVQNVAVSSAFCTTDPPAPTIACNT